MPTKDNKNLIDASKICANDKAVNNLITEELNGFREIENLQEMQQIMNESFISSDMNKGTVMGGSYEPIVTTLYPDREGKNRTFIFDDLTLRNLSDDDKAHLYVTNAIYATCKSRLLESSKQYAKDNHYDYCKFSDKDSNYTMTSADFDCYYKGTKLTTQTLEINAKTIVDRHKENIRGFIGYNVDIDNVDALRAKNIIDDINDGVIHMPTMIIKTGTGLHVWYIFTSPIATKNEKELQKYQMMMNLFTRKFTHNPRYCGKEEETGSFQHDLPIGQPMRAVGNIYDKYEGCNFPMRGYTSGVYYDIETLNQWADIPEIEISKKSSSIKYDSNKARKLSAREYQALFNSFLTESVGHRTRHRNLLFYHMLVEGGMTFDNALTAINNMIDEVNRLYPVEGNTLRNLTINEARKFDPNSKDFDYKYYTKYLSTSAMVDSQIYKNHIKQEKYRTGLNNSESAKKLNQEIVRHIELRAECLLYAIINTLNNDRKNKSGVAEYHGQQCIIGSYDFTPFVMAHSNTYNLGKDKHKRVVKNSYEVIDNLNDERNQIILKRIFEYLNGTLVQRIGSTDIYSNRQQLIHNLLLASTSQETRDEFYNRYTDVIVPTRYTVQSEELYREINTYSNILLTLAHHHFNKIKDGVRGERAYITGKLLTENYNKVDDALVRTKRLLGLFNTKRENVVKAGVSINLINAIQATNRKSLILASQMKQESLSRQLHEMLIDFNGKHIPMQQRLDKYENILNFVRFNNTEPSFDDVFQTWNGINKINSQANANNELFISEINRRWNNLQTLAPTILKIDGLIRRLIHKGKGNKTRLHGTFMYMCYLRHHLGFLDMLPPDVVFPFAKSYKYVGIELTKIGRELLEYDNHDSSDMRMYPTYDPKTGSRGYAYKCFTDREYVTEVANYYRMSGRYRSDEEVMILAKNLINSWNCKDLSLDNGLELLRILKKDTISYLKEIMFISKHKNNSERIVFEDTTDGNTDIPKTIKIVKENLLT